MFCIGWLILRLAQINQSSRVGRLSKENTERFLDVLEVLEVCSFPHLKQYPDERRWERGETGLLMFFWRRDKSRQTSFNVNQTLAVPQQHI